MRPFTVLIGIVLGSAASITFGLGAVLIVFCVLAARHPDLTRELPRLTLSLLAFAVLTAASAGSFFGQVKGRRWRAWAHVATRGVPWAPSSCSTGRAADAPVRRKESSIFIRNPAVRLALGGCLALLLACAAPHKVPPPSTEIDDAVFRNDIRLLASDEFEGRKPGTRGEEKTVAFLTDQFRKLGLKPAIGEVLRPAGAAGRDQRRRATQRFPSRDTARPSGSVMAKT